MKKRFTNEIKMLAHWGAFYKRRSKMIMIDLAEWIINFFIFSAAVLCSGVGIFIFCLILHAVLDWMTMTIKKGG